MAEKEIIKNAIELLEIEGYTVTKKDKFIETKKPKDTDKQLYQLQNFNEELSDVMEAVNTIVDIVNSNAKIINENTSKIAALKEFQKVKLMLLPEIVIKR